MPEPVPHAPVTRSPLRTRAATVALALAAALLALSLLLPYWELTLRTAAHPHGIELHSHMGRLEGERAAVEALGGGPGAARLRELAVLERSLATGGVTLACMLLLAAALVRNRWSILLALPAIAFPPIVVADTSRWLRSLGASPSGDGGAGGLSRRIYRLATDDLVLETRVGGGLLLAVTAALLVVAGIVLHRAAQRGRA